MTSIAFDLSPLLRGPAPYYPDWRWTYHPSFALGKLWAPSLVFVTILWLYTYYEKKIAEERVVSIPKLLAVFVGLSFLFQISILFYNQAGISVLLHRIINQDISGYFTSSLTISSFSAFISHYNENVGLYPMFARFHPPASIILLWIPTVVFSHFQSYLTVFSKITPTHTDVAFVWTHLENYQRASAVFSALFIPLLSSMAIVPLYFLTSMLYGSLIAIRALPLYMVIPSMVSFNPLNDGMFSFLSITLIYVFFLAIKRKSVAFFILTGFFYAICIYFTLTFIPFILFFVTYLVIYFSKRKNFYLNTINSFFALSFGALIIPFLLFVLYQFDTIQMVQAVMKYHEIARNGREYLVWFFYNIYDTLLFFGIPLSCIFIWSLFDFFKKRRSLIKNNILVSFLFMICFVNFSGATRGETARVWIPYLPLMFLVIIHFIDIKRFTKNQILFLIVLQGIQVFIFQSVLVTLS
ncbi:MAG: hypothetical protein HZC02_02300 [Candidatus Levybacteria bacterium]|nr:hypothetical protein [Candidatus Levybacteria bacterium]